MVVELGTISCKAYFRAYTPLTDEGIVSETRPKWPMSKVKLGKLAAKKYRQMWGLYTIEGAAAVGDALDAGADFHGILYSERAYRRDEEKRLLERLDAAGVSILDVGEAMLEQISGLVTPPPVIGIVQVGESVYPDTGKRGVVLALDRVQDPGNVGTLIRTAEFLGASQLWLGRGSVELYNPKVLRSAMTAHLHLPVAENVDLIDTLRDVQQSGGKILLAEMDGVETGLDMAESGPTVLVLGNEPRGIATELHAFADQFVAIPRRGRVDSLNVATAGAVLLDRILFPRN
jgi:TrmH family RNA methyltransferase